MNRRNGCTGRFGWIQTDHPAAGVIDVDHFSVGPSHPDEIIGLLDERLELLSLFLGAFTVANVTQIRSKNRRAVDLESSNRELDQNFRAVLAQSGYLDASSDDWSFPRFQTVGQSATMLFT